MLIREFKEDNLLVKVYASRADMGRAAAAAAGRFLRKCLGEKPFVNVVFAAAPSQNEMLEALIKEEGIEWNRVRAFHMDEYVGLAENSPNSFAAYLNRTILSRLPFKEVFLIGTGDQDAVCKRYEQLLKRHSIDLVCCGIGENGHIAFNDPHVARFKDDKLIKVVDLDSACRQQQINDKTFASLDEVPHYAVTLTVPALASASCIVCTVPGEKKAWAVSQTLFADINECVPSTILRRHSNAALFCDVAAARCAIEGEHASKAMGKSKAL